MSIEAIEIANLVPFRQTFEREIKALQPLMDMGLVSLDDTWLSITAPGRVVMRSVCAVFDRYLQSRRDHQTFSRVL
ncbi:MAG: hypothetical protein R3E83_13335 [Burkholderiaceae bacterium]